MQKIINFLITLFIVIVVSRSIGSMIADQRLIDAEKKRNKNAEMIEKTKELSLQEAIRIEVIESKSRLPRMITKEIRLESITEGDGRLIYNYEFVGIPAYHFSAAVVGAMRDEVRYIFRNSGCKNSRIYELLKKA